VCVFSFERERGSERVRLSHGGGDKNATMRLRMRVPVRARVHVCNIVKSHR